ncbi:MAG: hypothetical protein AB7P52_14245 [Alphaproteobacteria bacterium]
MREIYVAASKTIAEWGGEVGLTKQLYWLGIGEEGAAAAVAALNEARTAGADDWKLVKKAAEPALDEAEALDRLSRKEKPVDPDYYPRLKGARGLYKAKLENVERHYLVKQVLADEPSRAVKLKPAEIALYLIEVATRALPEAPPAEEDD